MAVSAGDWLNTRELAEMWQVSLDTARDRAKRRKYPARRRRRPRPYQHLDQWHFQVPLEDRYAGLARPESAAPPVPPSDAESALADQLARDRRASAPPGDAESALPLDTAELDPVTADALDRVPPAEPAPDPPEVVEPDVTQLDVSPVEPAGPSGQVERNELAARLLVGVIGLALLALLFAGRRSTGAGVASPPAVDPAPAAALPAPPAPDPARSSEPIVRTLT